MGFSEADYQILKANAERGRQRRRRSSPAAGVDTPKNVLEASRAVQRESKLHQEIIEECSRRGWIPEHGSTAHRTKRRTGELDFAVPIEGGVTLWGECKVGNNKPTSEQCATIAYLIAKGHRVGVWRSLRDFLDFIDGRELENQPLRHLRD